MSADGADRTAITHADGVYLSLPLEDYLRDRALSGSAFKRLPSDPGGLYWESDDNPLWLKPEPSQRRPRLRGSAAHVAILEGLPAYEARYTVKPEGALASETDLKRWLSAKRAEFIAASADGKLSKEDREAVKQTGERDDLIARVVALDPKVRIFDPDDGVDTLHPEDDKYVRLMQRFIHADPDFAPLVNHGLAEVSIFLTEGDLRFKARIDYLTATTILDLKTYGKPPRRGQDLRTHCVHEAAYNGYDLQAAHNAWMVQVAAERWCAGGNQLPISHAPGSTVDYDRCAEILVAAHNTAPVFFWLFLRMGGAPTAIALPFRESDGQWREAQGQILDACDLYRELRERAPWPISYGKHEIRDTDWPLAAVRGA